MTTDTQNAQEQVQNTQNMLKTTPGKVRIFANTLTGDLVSPTKKAGYSAIGIETVGFRFVNGFGRKVRTRALLTMENNHLADYLESNKLGHNSEISGKILVQESTEPFWTGQNPKINPETKAIITSGGVPVYRNTVFTEDITAVDKLLTVDKVTVVVEAKELA